MNVFKLFIRCHFNSLWLKGHTSRKMKIFLKRHRYFNFYAIFRVLGILAADLQEKTFIFSNESE